jgi:hypothetical protein
VLTNPSGSVLLVGGWPVTDYSNVDHRCINAIGALSPVKSQPGPPMTLGNAAAARVRLIVWCRGCHHRTEPAPAEMAARFGAEKPVLEWRERLVCSRCGSRQTDMVVTGEHR